MLRLFAFLPFLLSVRRANSDYEIRMQRDFSQYPVYDEFPIYWNVPSFMCLKHGIDFSQYTQRFGIRANSRDAFRGNNVTILYDPGAYPALLKSSKTGKLVERNGGIPQHGNLTMHLDALTEVVNLLIPSNYSSVAVVDFEAWRPNCRQNWNDQEIYIDMSRDDVRQKHPQWSENTVEKQACINFERTSRVFLESSIKLLTLLRPNAQWGYYGFPYCYNYRRNSGMVPWCHKDVQRENNQIQWLFDASKALYPSLYMSEKVKVNPRRFVIGRMNEASRMAWRVAPDDVPLVHPYMWYKYFDSLNFLSETDFYNAMETVRRYKVGGYVIWGASNDFTTKEKCQNVLTYLLQVIGPTIQRVRLNAKKKTYTEDSDDEDDIFSLSGARISLTSNGPNLSQSSNEHHNDIPQVQDDAPSTPNYNLATGAADPKLTIFSAVGPNGTRTIYAYDKEVTAQVQNANNVQNSEGADGGRQETTTARKERDVKEPTVDTPWLKEYMKGFESVLNKIVQRWTKN